MYTKKSQKDYFSDVSFKRFQNRISNPFLHYKEIKLAQIIASKMPEHGKKILEIGCGEGSNYFFIKKWLSEIEFVGLDFSIEKITFFNNTHFDSKGVCGDAVNLPFKNSVFDLILCRDILHHINEERFQVLQEAFRVLKQKGVLVVFENRGNTMLNCLYQLFYPAERGMKNSSLQELARLGTFFGEITLEYIEASFLIRALGFLFGWPKAPFRYIIFPLYVLALLWEKLFELFAPKSMWTYMMLTIKKI